MAVIHRARGDATHLEKIASRRFTGAFAAANRALAAATLALGRLRLGALPMRLRLAHLLSPQPASHSGPHHHPFLEATWVGSGAIGFLVADRRIDCRAGDTFVMTAGRHHGWQTGADGATLCGIMLDPEPDDPAGEAALDAAEAVCAALSHRLGDDAELAAAFAAVIAAATAPVSTAVLSARLHVVVALVIDRLSGARRRVSASASVDPVRAAMAYLRQRVGVAVSAAEVAERAGVSPRHLNRLLAARGQGSLGGELHRLRLERAADLLRDRRLSIAEVAAACGFDGPDWFTRAFRRRYGVTPSAARRSSG